MLVYGNRISGILKPIPETLGYSKQNEVYELHIQTEPFPEEDESIAIDMLMALEQKFPDLKVLHVESEAQGLIKVQFMDKGPGQISFGGLFSALPAIFIIVGIVIVAIILWGVLQQNPVLLWGLALIGGAVGFFILISDRLKTPPSIGAIRTEAKGVKKEASDKLEERRTGLNQLLIDYRQELASLSKEKQPIISELANLEKKRKKWTKADIERAKDLNSQFIGIKNEEEGMRGKQKQVQIAMEELLRQQAGLK